MTSYTAGSVNHGLHSQLRFTLPQTSLAVPLSEHSPLETGNQEAGSVLLRPEDDCTTLGAIQGAWEGRSETASCGRRVRTERNSLAFSGTVAQRGFALFLRSSSEFGCGDLKAQ